MVEHQQPSARCDPGLGFWSHSHEIPLFLVLPAPPSPGNHVGSSMSMENRCCLGGGPGFLTLGPESRRLQRHCPNLPDGVSPSLGLSQAASIRKLGHEKTGVSQIGRLHAASRKAGRQSVLIAESRPPGRSSLFVLGWGSGVR